MSVRWFRHSAKRLLSAGVVAVMTANLLIVVISPEAVSGYFTGCVANISPDTGDVGSDGFTFTITVNNTGGDALQWIDITTPNNTDYRYVGNSIGNGWTTTDHNDNSGVTIDGSSLDAGQTENFQVLVSTGIELRSAANWIVRVSPNTSSNAFNCQGSLQTSISGHTAHQSSNGVSNVTVTDITKNAATVKWNSDFATSSLVYYGLTNEYTDNSAHNTSNVTTHSVRLTGLSTHTVYHFVVMGTDGQGAVVYSIDNTFITADNVSQGGGGSSGSGAPVVTPTIVKVPGSEGDKTPPSVRMSTKLSAAYKTAPTISGVATDDRGVAYVEYSIDSGKNWLPVNQITDAGKPSVTFSFTPLISADNNYVIYVRAIDGADNKTISDSQTLVIDKLPPTVGGDVASVGAQAIKPNGQGVTRALIGSDMRIVLSAVGGPTTIAIDAVRNGKQKSTQSFSLTQSAVTGLWDGVLNFQFPGTYQLSVRALDGAGNRTERQIGVVTVDQPASIRDAKDGRALDGTLTVFYRDPETRTWVLWDGSSYDQTNPVKTTPAKGYGAYLPGGTYYFEAKSAGYAPTITKSFSVSEPTIVSSDLKLLRRPGVHLGPIRFSIPWFGNRQALVDLSQRSSATSVSSMTDKPLPNFTLPATSGVPISLDKLYGKPTVLTFVSTWAAPARDQLSILNELDNKNVNIVPVGTGESGSRLSSYMKVAGFTVPAAIDDTNKFTSQVGVSGLPTTVFVDRHGVVKKLIVGVLSKEEIVKHVSSGL